MTPAKLPQSAGFLPHSLWTKIVDRTQQALKSGALLELPTTQEVVEQNGVMFGVRMLTNLVRKAQQDQMAAKSGPVINPFLPYELDLFVADLSATHVCLLNKFKVVDHHILLVTRAFAPQESWLTLADFTALTRCLTEFAGLVFYNGGKQAGASQPHKHLQMIPGDPQDLPIAALLPTAQFVGAIGLMPQLPFIHAVTQFDASAPLEAAAMHKRYGQLLHHVGLPISDSKPQQTGAYNLLVTRNWMMVVPRSQEAFATIPVNALGFAGMLLVRDQPQMACLKSCGPMEILRHVAIARG